MTDATGVDGRVVVVLNPASGSGDHAPHVRQLCAEHGFDVRETESTEDAVATAADAASAATLVAACGGDGTLNQVVRGVRRAGELDSTTVGVVPAGTGNNFAGNVGVRSIAHAFEVLAAGERRQVDLGTVTGGSGGEAIDSPFVNSCVCGLTAEASSSTDPDQKDRIGTLAYVLNTLREVGEFDPIPLDVRTGDAGEENWSGEAVAVLVGNGRRFPAEGSTQADMEDGRLEVTIVESVSTLELVGGEVRRRLLEADADHLTRLRTPSLEVAVRRPESTSFSLDGEILDAEDVHLGVETGRLRLAVGDGYRPNPDT